MRNLFIFLFAAVAACGALEPSQVVVVYNGDSPLSTSTAKEYARLRGISQQQLVVLQGVPKNGTINRSDFDRTMRLPLLYAARANNWHFPAHGPVGGVKNMYAMVLMPDLPLRISESDEVNRARQKRREAKEKNVEWTPEEAACVDSELMLLGAEYPLKSGLVNPFYDKDKDMTTARPPVMAVTRIDGPNAACISRMVHDPIAVERAGGLWGWVVVDEGGPYAPGEKMFQQAAGVAKSVDLPLFYETSKKMIATSYPLMGNTAVYFGWYTEFAGGPFGPDAAKDFYFAKGAIAGHLHSFSCPDVKDPKRWAPALLNRGASVTFGNVYEPFLTGCHNFGIFFDRLAKGYSVGEAMLMATPLISWQEVTFGDPLYRPFAGLRSGRGPTNNPFVQWRELVRSCSGRMDAIEAGVKARLTGPDGAVFAEAYAWRCAEEKQFSKAAEYFRMAGNIYKTPRGKLRCTLMQITVLHLGGDRHQAETMMEDCLNANVRSPYLPAIEATAEVVIPKIMAERKKAQGK